MSNKLNSSCLRKADDDEPIFVLRAQDETAPQGVKAWIGANVERLGMNHPKIIGAYKTMFEMQAWPNRKLPD